MTNEEINALVGVLAPLIDQKVDERVNTILSQVMGEIATRMQLQERNLHAEILALTYPNDFAQKANDAWERWVVGEADKILAEHEEDREREYSIYNTEPESPVKITKNKPAVVVE